MSDEDAKPKNASDRKRSPDARLRDDKTREVADRDLKAHLRRNLERVVERRASRRNRENG